MDLTEVDEIPIVVHRRLLISLTVRVCKEALERLPVAVGLSSRGLVFSKGSLLVLSEVVVA